MRTATWFLLAIAAPVAAQSIVADGGRLEPLATDLGAVEQPVADGWRTLTVVDRAGGRRLRLDTVDCTVEVAGGAADASDAPAALSPDGRTEYRADPTAGAILALATDGSGQPAEARILTRVEGVPAALVVDAAGRLIGVGPRAIRVWSAAGDLLETIDLPGTPTGCALGGPGGRTLFVTVGPTVLALPLAGPAAHPPPAPPVVAALLAFLAEGTGAVVHRFLGAEVEGAYWRGDVDRTGRRIDRPSLEIPRRDRDRALLERLAGLVRPAYLRPADDDLLDHSYAVEITDADGPRARLDFHTEGDGLPTIFVVDHRDELLGEGYGQVTLTPEGAAAWRAALDEAWAAGDR